MEKRPNSGSSSPSSHSRVTKGTGEGDGDGAAGEKTKSKLSSDDGSGINEKGGNGEPGLTFTIDTDMLHCPICSGQLCPPLFQCCNGHIACSTCRHKVENNCPSCKSAISYRNLAVEKIMESINVYCPYASSGCDQLISYQNIDAHRKMCDYSPCHCPAANCNFEAPMRELYHHLFVGHVRDGNITFQYNRAFSAVIYIGQDFRVLHAQDGVPFLILNKLKVGMGSAIMVACFGPDTVEGKYTYSVKAKDEGKVSSVQLESSPVCSIRRHEDGILPKKNFLLIPEAFYVWSEIKLEITIFNKGDHTGGKNTARQKGSTDPSSK